MSQTAAAEIVRPAIEHVLSPAAPLRRRVIALRSLADVRSRPIPVDPAARESFARQTIALLPQLGTYIPDPLMVTNRMISEHIDGRIEFDLMQFRTLCRYHVSYANRSAPRHLRTAFLQAADIEITPWAAPSP